MENSTTRENEIILKNESCDIFFNQVFFMEEGFFVKKTKGK
jgi:hypothetical protein